MISALKDMLGRPFTEANLCFITTASVAEPGNHDWFVEDLNRVYSLGWRSFDVLDLNGVTKELVVKRLEQADVIYIEGGNTYHLAKSIIDDDLVVDFLSLLETKVYVGVSAGSMIFSKHFTEHLTTLFGEADELYQLNDRKSISPFNLFDWFVMPHVNDGKSPDPKEFPIYAIDDQTALKIIDGKVEVISEGKWEFVS